MNEREKIVFILKSGKEIKYTLPSDTNFNLYKDILIFYKGFHPADGNIYFNIDAVEFFKKGE